MPVIPTVNGLPVLLPPHDDTPDFGNPGQHYHIDYRYCTDIPEQDRVVFSNEVPAWEMRELVRDDYQLVNSSIMVLFLLTKKYHDKELNCNRCPHKGIIVTSEQCPGHGLAFKKKGKVDKELFLQLIDIPEGRMRITLKQMREWVEKKEAKICFNYGRNTPSAGKIVKGIEVVNRHSRSLARILFKQTNEITNIGCQVNVTIT